MERCEGMYSWWAHGYAERSPLKVVLLVGGEKKTQDLHPFPSTHELRKMYQLVAAPRKIVQGLLE